MLRNGGYCYKMRNHGTILFYSHVQHFDKLPRNITIQKAHKHNAIKKLKNFCNFSQTNSQKIFGYEKISAYLCKNMALFYDLWLESVILVILFLIRVGGG